MLRQKEKLSLCSRCRAEIHTVSSPLCIVCGLPFPSRIEKDHPCGRCVESPPRFRRARAWAYYSPSDGEHSALNIAIQRFKYQRIIGLGKELGETLADYFPLAPTEYDVVLPVPLHLRRLRWRGFNQAFLLARPLGQRYGIVVNPHALARIRWTEPQVNLRQEERRRNVRRAFAVSRPAQVAGKRVLLVDDVYTSGATVNECSRVLRAAGARFVDVLTLARAVFY